MANMAGVGLWSIFCWGVDSCSLGGSVFREEELWKLTAEKHAELASKQSRVILVPVIYTPPSSAHFLGSLILP